MTDFDRLKVGIYQYLFAEDSRRDKAVDVAQTKMRRKDCDQVDAAIEYILALAMRTQFDLMQRALFDILRRG